MRILYFPKYIRDHELQPAIMRNCSVVIDGQNYLYNMCEESGLSFAFGCESDQLAAHIKKRLNMFKEANVKCYFVFKGGDADIQRKIKKMETWNEDQKFDFIENNKFVPPVLMKAVYKQALADMGIPHAVCEFESKRDCVALAKQLQCPVISNDIEFCFLEAPYIQHKTLKYNGKMKAIECKQYKRDYFLKKHSLTQQKLAIFAVLTDKNLFPDNFFDDFLVSLHAFHKDFHARYIALWRWLSRLPESEALDVINKTLSQENKDKFSSEMYRVMDFMQTKQQSVVADYLLNGSQLEFKPRDPNWFEKGVASKTIAIPYINLYAYNYLFKRSAVESTNSNNSLLLSMDILKYAYNLLTDFKRDGFKFVVVDNVMKIGAKRAAPDAFEAAVFANGWGEIKEKRLFENFLKENSIDESLVSTVPEDAAMLIVSLVYFARKKLLNNITVDKEVCSVITCFALISSNGGISSKERDEARKAVRAYFIMASTGEKMRLFDRELLHNFVEIQQCLEQMNNLNALCGAPYAPTVYHRTYNATFVYKLFHGMAHSDDDCATFLNKMFNCSTSVLNYIIKLIDLYKTIL